MSRREISKREKLRSEEQELDKQLRDAGFELQDLSYEEKKNLFAMLEESRKCAEEEENQRKQMRENEERILHETLNKSYSHVVEDVKMIDSPKKKEESEDAVTSGTPDSGQVCETDCLSNSGSITPDLVPLPSESPAKPTTSQFQSPVRSSSNSLAPRQSPGQSDDMFMFSQNSTKFGVDENVIKDCIETIRVSESEEEDEDVCTPLKSISSPRGMSFSPIIKSRTPVRQLISNTTRSTEKSSKNSLFAQVSPAKPRPSLRRYGSAEVSSPRSRTQESKNEEVNSSSQPFSLEVKQRQLSKLVERMDDETFISPVIGQRRMTTSNEKLSMSRRNVASIQDAEISNSLSVKPQRMASPDLISDEEDGGRNIIQSSGEAQSLFKEDDEAHSSSELKILNGDVMQNKLKRKIGLFDGGGGTSEVESQEPCTASSEKVTIRYNPRDNKNLKFQSLNLSDSDEDQIIQNKKDGKKNINVFCTTAQDISLKRKLEKSEVPERTYFRNTDESPVHALERILDLINKSFLALEKHQSTLTCRMPWSAPIKVDKRVKDSLDHPKVSSRRQVEVPQAIIDGEMPRMITRHSQPKTSGMVEEDPYLSEQSLSELMLEDDGSWYDARKRIRNKRRGAQQGLSRKQAKLSPSEDSEARVKPSVDRLSLINESDSEDFDLSSSRISRLSPAARQQGSATPAKKLDSGDNKVSSLSRSEGEGRTNFDIGDILSLSPDREPSNSRNEIVEPSTSRNEVGEPSTSRREVGEPSTNRREVGEPSTSRREVGEPSTSRKEVGVPVVKEKAIGFASISRVDDCQPSTSGLRYPAKRLRKTFRLTVENDLEPLQNREASSTCADKSDTPNPARASPSIQVDTRAVNTKEEKSGKSGKSKKNDLVFVSSFDDVKKGPPGRQNSDEEMYIIDSSSMSKSGGSAPRKGKSNPVQLKPPPLRLRTKQGRGRATATEERQRDDEDIYSQLPSTSDLSQQVARSNPKVVEEKAEEEVECPLCQKSFPITVIEAHASNCGEPMAEMEQLPQPSVNHSKGKRRMVQNEDRIQAVSSDEDIKVARMSSNRNRRERTPPNFVRCIICKSAFKEGDEIMLHDRDCQQSQRERADMSPSSSRTPSRGYGSPNPNIASSSTSSSSSIMRITKTQVTQSTSVFDRLEGVSKIQFHQGDITDAVYRHPNTALAHIINCVAVRPHGLSEVLAKKYPYSNTYVKRTPIEDLNRACVNDRADPGTIKICRSSDADVAHSPIVVNVFGQFYMGKSYNHNFMSKRLVAQLKPKCNSDNPARITTLDSKNFDPHLLRGVESDTEENRIKWFRQSLQYLEEAIPKENIKRVVFPFKIGCGLAGGNWEKAYYPAIQAFHSRVSERGVEVVIVNKVESAISDQAIAAAGTKRLSLPFDKMSLSPKGWQSNSRKSL